ncbi:hypothetical protein [Streptomyces roseicoloratus]|uniref:hypothetical protein n=1 Tax=Streptomyces roseicoloratus TaxID=2508722 RepID=UPI001FEA16A3|nr:hypothetical protein [Streptomyces roseicoloratus]
MGPEAPAVRVPVGEGAGRWTSRAAQRRVLLVVHNVTSAGRLLDLLPLFHDDFRVQVLVTSTGSSAFQGGIRELFRDLELPELPWSQALSTPLDLAISASFGGELELIQGKLSILSHGVGYTKKLGKPGAGSREPTFGLSSEWLLAGGRRFVDGLVLSHPEQLERLARVCAEATPAAVLAGDPCFDRMLAARPYRDRFRRALGVRRGQRLVVLNSTWNPEGLFGNGGGQDVLPALLPRLAAELPADDYRLAAVLHPNIWYGHGPGQIRAWLDRARRDGLTLVDPVHEWRQALLAADLVLGDFGAVSYYAAALGTPVLLAADGAGVLDPEAPLAEFVRRAPRLEPRAPLLPQVRRGIDAHRPDPAHAGFVTSEPGRSAALLRRHFYALMDLPEPTGPAALEPLPLPPYRPGKVTSPLHVRTRVEGTDVVVERSTGHPPGAAGDAHLAVHEDTRHPGDLDVADLILRDAAADDPRLGGPGTWTAEVLRLHPHCSTAAYVTGPHACVVRSRGRRGTFRLTADTGADGGAGAGAGARDRAPGDADPAAYASAFHVWLAYGGTVPERGIVLRLHGAGGVHPFRVEAEG